MKISKSLSLKCNLGNYQVADFFVSIEQEVELNKPESYYLEAAEKMHEWCKKEITKDVNNSKKYLQDLANGKVGGKKVCDTCGGDYDSYHIHLKHRDCVCTECPRDCKLCRPCIQGSEMQEKTEKEITYSDPANDLLGEYPDSMNPPRRDKKV